MSSGCELAINNNSVTFCFSHFSGKHLVITKPFSAWMLTPGRTQTLPECERQTVVAIYRRPYILLADAKVVVLFVCPRNVHYF